MNIVCPHCSQTLSLTPEVLASLSGQRQVACPMCSGVMALPEMKPTPSRPEMHFSPRPSAPASKTTAAAIVKANRGLTRNMRLLGVGVLLLLGGLAAYLALNPGGTTHNTKRHIIEEIIRNKFFTDLIASGATTKEALLGLADLQPHGVGFIGLSEERLPWAEATAMADKLGAKVLTLDPPDATARQVMLRALTPFTADHLAETLWLLDHGQPKVFEGVDVHRVSTLERPRRVLLAWSPVKPKP